MQLARVANTFHCIPSRVGLIASPIHLQDAITITDYGDAVPSSVHFCTNGVNKLPVADMPNHFCYLVSITVCVVEHPREYHIVGKSLLVRVRK